MSREHNSRRESAVRLCVCQIKQTSDRDVIRALVPRTWERQVDSPQRTRHRRWRCLNIEEWWDASPKNNTDPLAAYQSYIYAGWRVPIIVCPTSSSSGRRHFLISLGLMVCSLGWFDCLDSFCIRVCQQHRHWHSFDRTLLISSGSTEHRCGGKTDTWLWLWRRKKKKKTYKLLLSVVYISSSNHVSDWNERGNKIQSRPAN